MFATREMRLPSAKAGEFGMIYLTRLNGEPFLLNADMIRYIEARPDTFVTLTSGDRVVVTESMDEVLLRTVRYQQAKHMVPPPGRIEVGSRQVLSASDRQED